MLNPASADAQFLRGSALLSLKRDAEAVPCFDRAVALDPKLAPAWFNRAVALAALGRYEEALTLPSGRWRLRQGLTRKSPRLWL